MSKLPILNFRAKTVGQRDRATRARLTYAPRLDIVAPASPFGPNWLDVCPLASFSDHFPKRRRETHVFVWSVVIQHSQRWVNPLPGATRENASHISGEIKGI